MDAVSMNNLWTYLQGLSLTADNWQWLAERAKENALRTEIDKIVAELAEVG